MSLNSDFRSSKNPINLPPHFAVRRYFREQEANHKRLVDQMSARQLTEWQDVYGKGRVAITDLRTIADQQQRILEEASCFSLVRSSVLGSKAMPQRERHSISAFYMAPMALRQGWLEPDQVPYTENVIMLRCIRTTFTSKKAFIGIGASTLFLTQHMLERVYERTEINHEHISELISAEIDRLLKNLALAEIANLWIEENGNRITAVPYANGLIFANTRIVFGNSNEGDFGFRFEIPRGSMKTPYINNNMRLDDVFNFQTSDDTPVAAICSLTYLSLSDLNDRQLDYYYAFQALRDTLPDDATTAMAFLTFAPNLDHERWAGADLSDDYERLRSRAATLLQTGWLKSDRVQPIARIMPYPN